MLDQIWVYIPTSLFLLLLTRTITYKAGADNYFFFGGGGGRGRCRDATPALEKSLGRGGGGNKRSTIPRGGGVTTTFNAYKTIYI